MFANDPDVRTFILDFKPTNPFITMRIATHMYNISSCRITKGLLDLTAYSDPICTPDSTIMTITNFKMY